MAAIVIAGGVAPDVLFGGGLVVGVVMLTLTASGALGWLVRVIPRAAVRGVQLGLGLKLAGIALTRYMSGLSSVAGPPATPEIIRNYAIAAGGCAVVLLMWGNRKVPGALLLVAGSLVFALGWRVDLATISAGFGISLPTPRVPSWEAIAAGAVVLALPQIPLSLSNSVIGTTQTARDLFPSRPVSVNRIGLSYSLLNIISPFFGGIPVCHGCGGLAGHHAFGGRTGGSPMIYGTMLVTVGLCFASVFTDVLAVFPMPVLGVLLLFEAVALMMLSRDLLHSRSALFIAVLVGIIATSVPYGFLVGLVVGTALSYGWKPAAIAEER
jgi:MFS superfamily sulfate permease-like transporter